MHIQDTHVVIDAYNTRIIYEMHVCLKLMLEYSNPLRQIENTCSSIIDPNIGGCVMEKFLLFICKIVMYQLISEVVQKSLISSQARRAKCAKDFFCSFPLVFCFHKQRKEQ